MKKLLLLAAFALSASFIYSCGSSEPASEQPKFASETEPAKPASAAMIAGEAIYKRTCVACHQATGEGLGNAFPPLAKSDFLADKDKTISQVIHGFTGKMVVNGKEYNSTMPPQPLNDEEVAAVLTYVYGSFGNDGRTISPEDVKAVREKK